MGNVERWEEFSTIGEEKREIEKGHFRGEMSFFVKIEVRREEAKWGVAGGIRGMIQERKKRKPRNTAELP